MAARILVSKAQVQDLQSRLGLSADGVIGPGTWRAITALLPATAAPAVAEITVPRLITAGLAPTQARQWQPHLAKLLPEYGINTPNRIGAFIGQIMIESAGFTRLEENLRYTSPARLIKLFRAVNAGNVHLVLRNPKALANLVYANRLGNGDQASGDGWRYRGRGLKQLTGKSNYEAAGRALGRPYVTNPDLVMQEHDAALTAAWFWKRNGCNAPADAGNWDRVTRIVNGKGMVQKNERRLATIKAVRAFQ